MKLRETTISLFNVIMEKSINLLQTYYEPSQSPKGIFDRILEVDSCWWQGVLNGNHRSWFDNLGDPAPESLVTTLRCCYLPCSSMNHTHAHPFR